jgi:hypothetical protein
MIKMHRWFARATKIPPVGAVSWQASNRMFFGTFTGILATIYLFVLLVDPYGVVPFSPSFERPIMSAQRQMYPQILRTGRYDSIVVGTSTIRLLDPVALNRALGGHFANLALPNETAWEQVQIIDYFRRTVAAPKAMLIGVDHEWCYRDSNAFARENAAVREKEFPFWAYDDNRWNDIPYLLNTPTLDVATRTVGRLLGKVPEEIREDGYQSVVPPGEAAYDPARAHDKIWGRGESLSLASGWPLELVEARPDAMDFPALQWLDTSLASLPGTVRTFLVLPPVHVHMLPAPGSPREALEAECKRRLAAIARQRGALLVDWRIVSPLATEDAHFWDLVHYRLPIAYRLIDDLGHIVSEGRESPDGSYRILVR